MLRVVGGDGRRAPPGNWDGLADRHPSALGLPPERAGDAGRTFPACSFSWTSPSFYFRG